MSKNIHRLFVYGQLKKNCYFHDRYLGGEKSKFLGKVTCGPDYQMYSDGLPHLIREPAAIRCKGELYEIDDEKLKELDLLEGAPLIYFREIVDVYDDESGDKILAWAYLRAPSFKGKKYAFKESEFI